VIIDVRYRYTAGTAAEYYRKALVRSGRLHLVPAVTIGTEEAFFSEMEASGVTTAVSASGLNPGAKLGKYDLPDRLASNDELADVQRRNPGRFIACAGLDVSNTMHDAVDEARRCHAELGINIFGIEPGRAPGWTPGDARLFGLYEVLEGLASTLIVQTSGLKGGRYLDYAHPSHIEVIAEHFPGLRIICAHGCYPFVREAIATAMRRENIWLSPEGYLWHLGHEDWLRAINQDLEGFSRRFLFGSAYPLTPSAPFVRNFLALPWTDEALPRILYRNALDALGLAQDPMFRSLYALDEEHVDPR
jgi:predicted TIM-barrel fold metal-dependent hydrolase